MPKKTPRRLTFEVTQEDLDGAMRRDSTHCAIADSLRRSYPQASHISVDLQSVRFSIAGERRTYWTPRWVQLYLIAFDAGRPVDPTTVVLKDLVQVRPNGRANRSHRASTVKNTEARPIRVGGPPMPRLHGNTTRRGFGIRSMPDNQ